MESLFIQLSDDVSWNIFNFEKLTLMTGFVVQGHIYLNRPNTPKTIQNKYIENMSLNEKNI